MLKVGDRVNVTFTKKVYLGGAALPDNPTTIQGKIVEDAGDNWLVELAFSVGGKNRTLIPKASALVSNGVNT